MAFNDQLPMDLIKTILNESEFAESMSYTAVDLDGAPPGDSVTTVAGLFDPSLDVEDDTTIETGIEVLIANGEISRITMASPAPSGLFVVGESLAAPSGANGTYAGMSSGTLYFRPTSGTFGTEVITGATSGATWTSHATPAITVEGIALPKAGDHFNVHGYRWQVDAVERRRVAGGHLIGAQRGALLAV